MAPKSPKARTPARSAAAKGSAVAKNAPKARPVPISEEFNPIDFLEAPPVEIPEGCALILPCIDENNGITNTSSLPDAGLNFSVPTELLSLFTKYRVDVIFIWYLSELCKRKTAAQLRTWCLDQGADRYKRITTDKFDEMW